MNMKKNFLYNFLLTGSNLLFPLLTFPYLSRILGADGLGICNFIISYGQNYMIIAALGIPVYGIREIAKIGDDKAKRSKLFFEILTIHLIFTCLLLVIYILSVYFYSGLRQYRDLALLGGSLILFNVFAIEWLFAGVNDFKYIAIRNLIIRALSAIAIFLLVKKSSDFSIYFLVSIITVFFTTAIDVYSAKKLITRKIRLSTKGILNHIKPLAVLGIYMVLTSIYSVLPATVLGFMSTKSAVGYYYGANRIIRMVISLFSALITVMIPRLNFAFEEKKNVEYLSQINNALNAVITFGIPITFYVFLSARPIVLILAGEKFINSILLIRLMSPIILLVAFAQIFVLLILSVNRKDKEMVFLSIIGMSVSLAINLVFIPIFAEKATGISQLLSELFVTLLAFFIARKVVKFNFPIKKIVVNVLCVIPFAFAFFSISYFTDNSLVIILSTLLFCALYFLYYQKFILKNLFISIILKNYFEKLTSCFINSQQVVNNKF